MESVTLPESGVVAVDANIVIYSVEKHPLYSSVLRPLWESVAAGTVSIVISELILLETLVGPYRAGASQLAADYETFLSFPGIRLVPISPAVLRAAAQLRAKVPKLRSPQWSTSRRLRQRAPRMRW